MYGVGEEGTMKEVMAEKYGRSVVKTSITIWFSVRKKSFGNQMRYSHIGIIGNGRSGNIGLRSC